VSKRLVCEPLCTNQSFHVWICHVTYKWAMSRMNRVTQTRIWTIGCGYVIPHINESFHIWMNVSRRLVYAQLCHICFSYSTCESRVSHINESCPRWLSLTLNYVTQTGIWTTSVLRAVTGTYCGWLHYHQCQTKFQSQIHSK